MLLRPHLDVPRTGHYSRGTPDFTAFHVYLFFLIGRANTRSYVSFRKRSDCGTSEERLDFNKGF